MSETGSEASTHLLDLPLAAILRHLPVPDLLRCSEACQALYEAGKSQAFFLGQACGVGAGWRVGRIALSRTCCPRPCCQQRSSSVLHLMRCAWLPQPRTRLCGTPQLWPPALVVSLCRLPVCAASQHEAVWHATALASSECFKPLPPVCTAAQDEAVWHAKAEELYPPETLRLGEAYGSWKVR